MTNPLANYLEARGRGEAARVARACALTEPALSAIRSGKRKPSLVTAYHIEKATDGEVRMQDWVADQSSGSP